MTTILTNILIFIVATVMFTWTSGQTHEIYKLPGLLISSILSAVWIILANISSIACTYGEEYSQDLITGGFIKLYRMAGV